MSGRYNTEGFGEIPDILFEFESGDTVDVIVYDPKTDTLFPTTPAAPGNGTELTADPGMFKFDADDIDSPPTAYTQLVAKATNQRGLIKRQKFVVGGFTDDIAVAQYQGAIWFDAVNGTNPATPVPGIHGTPSSPVNNRADVLTLLGSSQLSGISSVRVRGDFGTIGVGEDFSGISFEGVSPQVDLVDIDGPAGGLVAGGGFTSLGVTGDFDGQAADFERCFCGTDGVADFLELGSSTLLLCAFLGVVRPATGAQWRIESGRGGAGILDFVADGVLLDLVNGVTTSVVGANMAGLWRIGNAASANLIFGAASAGGEFTIEDTCTNALALRFAGTGNLINESALTPDADGGPILDEMLHGGDLHRLYTGNQEQTLYYSDNGTGAPRNVAAGGLSHIGVKIKDEHSTTWANELDEKFVVFTYASGASATDRPDSSLTQLQSNPPTDDTSFTSTPPEFG